MMTKTRSTLQIMAILLMFAGWGWTGGNFTPGDAPFLNPLLHCIPLVLLLLFSLPLLRMRDSQQAAPVKWADVALSILAIASIIGCIVMVILGASNPDPNAVGVKTLEDWFPVVILNMGTFLWLGTRLFPHQRAIKVNMASNQ